MHFCQVNTCGMLVDALPPSALGDEDVNHYASSFSRNDRGKSTLFDNDDEDFNEKPVRTKVSTVRKVHSTRSKYRFIEATAASLWNPSSSILSSQLAKSAVNVNKEENGKGDNGENNTAKIAKYILEFQVSFEENIMCTFSPRSRFNAQMSCGTFGAACPCNTQSPKDTIRIRHETTLGAFSEIAVYAQTADDEEFYVIGKPLTIDESKFLVEIAKNTLWFQFGKSIHQRRSLNNNSSNRAVRTEDSQIEATASVLQNLFDRNGHANSHLRAVLCRRTVWRHGFWFFNAGCGFLPSRRQGRIESFERFGKCSCLAPFEVRVRAFGTAMRNAGRKWE